MRLLERNGDRICVIKHNDGVQSSIFRLKGTKEHGFTFYGTERKFLMFLDKDLPLSKQPFGRLGSCADLSGRRCGGNTNYPLLVAGSGQRGGCIEYPRYSLMETCRNDKLLERLSNYHLQQRDFPCACVSVSSLAVGGAGDDLYVNTLFFMSGGYGILTEITAITGRDIEDCCSPEYNYISYKVRLGKLNPLQVIQEADVCPGVSLVDWTISTSPEISTAITTRSFEEVKKFLNSRYQMFLN